MVALHCHKRFLLLNALNILYLRSKYQMLALGGWPLKPASAPVAFALIYEVFVCKHVRFLK